MFSFLFSGCFRRTFGSFVFVSGSEWPTTAIGGIFISNFDMNLIRKNLRTINSSLIMYLFHYYRLMLMMVLLMT